MFLLKKTGIYSLVQDKGRFGFRSFGISVNGVRDAIAANLANQLLRNDETAALIEIVPPNFEIEVITDCYIAIVGAVVDVFINGNLSNSNKIILLKKGDILTISKVYKGTCVYLAMLGGVKVETWLNSKSTNLKAKVGGYKGSYLKKGDILEPNIDFSATIQFNTKQFLSNHYLSHLHKNSLRCLIGPEWFFLSATAQNDFLNKQFLITTHSDRMGWRLESHPLDKKSTKEIRSVAVNFGTIQLLPNGQLIILGPDAQTTGGYPRIAHIVSDDFPIIGQLAINQFISFQIVNSL